MPRDRLDADKVRAIRAHRAAGMLLKEIAAEFDVSITTVFKVVHGICWRHVS